MTDQAAACPEDEAFMRRAIEVGRQGIAAGQTPFGAVLVAGGTVLAACHNTVWRQLDPTAHAEINTLREAAAAWHSIDLSGTVLYSTCEPCPMCLAATHWAKVSRVVFGATIDDARLAGFSELTLSAASLVELGQSPLIVVGGVLRAECADLFRLWREAGRSTPY